MHVTSDKMRITDPLTIARWYNSERLQIRKVALSKRTRLVGSGDGRSEPKFSSVVHMDGWMGGWSADGRLRPWKPGSEGVF